MVSSDCLQKFYEENPLIEICFNEEIYPPYLRRGKKYVLIHNKQSYEILDTPKSSQEFNITNPNNAPLSSETCIINLVIYKDSYVNLDKSILAHHFCCLYNEKETITVYRNIFYETFQIYNYIEHFAVK